MSGPGAAKIKAALVSACAPGSEVVGLAAKVLVFRVGRDAAVVEVSEAQRQRCEMSASPDFEQMMEESQEN